MMLAKPHSQRPHAPGGRHRDDSTYLAYAWPHVVFETTWGLWYPYKVFVRGSSRRSGSAGRLVAILMTGCAPIRLGSTAGQRTAGYRVVAGNIPPAASSGDATDSTGLLMVPDFADHWLPTSSTSALFPNSSKVELVATGRAGVRFRLFWEESCGAALDGGQSLSATSGGQTQLTLDTPARVLVKLPAPSGPHDKCYLSTTVLMPAKTLHGATTATPHVQIVHHEL
jgi:hypothetical protein